MMLSHLPFKFLPIYSTSFSTPYNLRYWQHLITNHMKTTGTKSFLGGRMLECYVSIFSELSRHISVDLSSFLCCHTSFVPIFYFAFILYSSVCSFIFLYFYFTFTPFLCRPLVYSFLPFSTFLLFFLFDIFPFIILFILF
jgi:hypothetical protein